MDVGASTGGFTDCMLQNGGVKVYSIDGIWPAGLEASQRPKSCVHGENQHSLCGTGGYPGETCNFPLLMFPLFP